ncbi:ESX secretion-associated protein EspG [Parasphingorhabdus pacifica]
MRCGIQELDALLRHEGPETEHIGRSGNRELPAFLADGARTEAPANPPDDSAFTRAMARDNGWTGDDGRLLPQWVEILTTLTRGPERGMLLVRTPEAETRTLVVRRHDTAYRLVLRDGELDIDEVPARAPWFALTQNLPTAEPAQGKPMTLPAKTLDSARAEAHRHAGDPGEWAAYELQLRKVPAITAKVLGAWLKRADSVTAELGVALREPTGSLRVGPFTIAVHRSMSGRVAVLPQLPDGSRTTVAPGSSVVIARTAQHYLDDLRLDAQPAERPGNPTPGYRSSSAPDERP